MTWKQAKRQSTREGNGRYAKLNPCECCGRSAGADYCSDDRCNTTGHGLILCAKCCGNLSTMDDAQFFMALGVDPKQTSGNG